MTKASFYIRQKKNDEVIYSHVDGFRFNWHDHPFGIWHKGRSQWVMIDIRSGLAIIQIPNRKDLDNHLTDDLFRKVAESYKKPFYKRVCDELNYHVYGDKWFRYGDKDKYEDIG